MSKKYYVWKEKNSKKLDKFISDNIFFAFDNKQFDKGLEKLGVKKEEVKEKLCSLFGGGFMLKSSKKQYNKIINRMHRNKRKYLSHYPNLYNAILYEMGNYECGYTWNFTTCLAPLGFSKKDLLKNKKLAKAFHKAKEKIIAYEQSH